MVNTIIGALAIAWGLATIYVGLARPKSLWNNGKIQGFVGLMSETGTSVFFTVIGLAALALGLWLVV